MAQYIVTSPDGQEYEITAPDDATQEQVLAYAKANIKPEAKPAGVGDYLKETAQNVPGSALGIGKNIYQAVAHPITTAGALLDVGAGALQEAAPEALKRSGNPLFYSKRAEEMFDKTVDFYKNRYGSVENVLSSIKRDPVGVAMDLSAVTGLIGKAASAGGLAKVGNIAETVSSAVDPVRAVGRLTRGLVRPAYMYAAGLTTGAGATAIKQALKGGDAFTQAMRGEISETDVLDAARSALEDIKAERGTAYRSRLQALKSSSQQIDLAPVKQTANQWLSNYGIKITKDGLDFSRSTLRANPAAAAEVKEVYQAVSEWGTQAGDATPVGMDTLKRVIENSYASQNPSRAMVSSLKNMVKTQIVKTVPEYAQMTRDYAQASDLINDMNRALSLGDKASTDMALRKLMTGMREDATFRRSLIEKLTEASGKDVAGAVSGLLLKNPWSNRLGPIAHFYGTSAIAAYLRNPTLAALLPLASPRAVGEASRFIGKVPWSDLPYQGAFQAGRIGGLSEGGLE